MIIFPLITTWMWFQIITASPLPSLGAVRLRTALTLTPRYFRSECHLNEAEHDPGLFHRSKTNKFFAFAAASC